MDTGIAIGIANRVAYRVLKRFFEGFMVERLGLMSSG